MIINRKRWNLPIILTLLAPLLLGFSCNQLWTNSYQKIIQLQGLSVQLLSSADLGSVIYPALFTTDVEIKNTGKDISNLSFSVNSPHTVSSDIFTDQCGTSLAKGSTCYVRLNVTVEAMAPQTISLNVLESGVAFSTKSLTVTPTDANLMQWYDFDDLSTVTLTGTNVDAVQDKSPNANNLLNNGTPQYVVAGLNGRNVVSIIPNHSLYMTPLSAGPTGDMTVFCVFAPTITAANWMSVWNYGNEQPSVYLEANAVHGWSSSLGDLAFGVAATVTNGAANIYTFHLEGTHVRQWVNETEGQDYNGFVAVSAGNFNIGANAWEEYEGKVGEFVSFNRALTVNEIAYVRDYLSQKWGL